MKVREPAPAPPTTELEKIEAAFIKAALVMIKTPTKGHVYSCKMITVEDVAYMPNSAQRSWGTLIFVPIVSPDQLT